MRLAYWPSSQFERAILFHQSLMAYFIEPMPAQNTRWKIVCVKARERSATTTSVEDNLGVMRSA